MTPSLNSNSMECKKNNGSLNNIFEKQIMYQRGMDQRRASISASNQINEINVQTVRSTSL